MTELRNIGLPRLTIDNARVGAQILFQTKGIYVARHILGVGRISIKVDYPELNNCLVLTRYICLLP